MAYLNLSVTEVIREEITEPVLIQPAFEIYSLNSIIRNPSLPKPKPHYTVLWVNDCAGLLGINERQYEFSNTIFILPPGKWICRYDREAIDGYGMNINPSFLKTITLPFPSVFNQTSYRNETNPVVLPVDYDTQKTLEGILIKLEKEFTCPLILRNELVSAWLQVFLFYLSRIMKPIIPDYGYARKLSLMNGFMLLVSRHFCREKKVSFYAHELCVSPNYLNQVIKKVSGHTASRYIQEYVVTEAKRLAGDHHRSMKQIAYELGFDDTAHFSKFFRQFSGVNFSIYRKEQPSLLNKVFS